MYLPPLQPIANSEIQIYGDVEIHPTASIAPGVILKAAPNAQIIIGADVCLGMGVILNAYNGLIEIDSGVTLGSGVLIIGASKIGANCCIGTTTTIFDTSVAAMSVVNPGSIIGDNSRACSGDTWSEDIPSEVIPELTAVQESIPTTNNIINNNISEKQPAQPSSNQTKLINEYHLQGTETNPEITDLETDSKLPEEIAANNSVSNQELVNDDVNLADFDPWETEEIKQIESEATVNQEAENKNVTPGVAIGKVYIDQLLVTLFPHKNSLNNNPNNNSK